MIVYVQQRADLAAAAAKGRGDRLVAPALANIAPYRRSRSLAMSSG